MSQSQTRKHPRALPFLFFTEMWERFGFYLMIGIFQLYMMAPLAEGGLAFDRKQAADVYGTFIAFVFLTPFLGGMLASSSTTIIIRAFDELGVKNKSFARVVFGFPANLF